MLQCEFGHSLNIEKQIMNAKTDPDCRQITKILFHIQTPTRHVCMNVWMSSNDKCFLYHRYIKWSNQIFTSYTNMCVVLIIITFIHDVHTLSSFFFRNVPLNYKMSLLRIFHPHKQVIKNVKVFFLLQKKLMWWVGSIVKRNTIKLWIWEHLLYISSREMIMAALWDRTIIWNFFTHR